MTGTKVVVTGGAGFIGSHLVTNLLEKGYHVAVIDDVSTGRITNIERHLSSGSFEFHNGTINDEDLLSGILEDTRYVFHLAAMVSVPQSIQHPKRCHEINVNGTLSVLSAAKEAGVEKVVNISSCAIYGDTESVPTSEAVPPNPLTPYALTKHVAEQYNRLFNDLYQMQTVNIRFFNVFGPQQDPDSPYAAVIPIFINRTLSDKPLTVFGDGEQTRDFIYVDDAARACILACEHEDTFPEYNVGTGTSISLNQLIEKISAITGKQIACTYEDPRQGDIKHSAPDTSRLRALGFTPKVSFEEGLKKTIASLKDRM